MRLPRPSETTPAATDAHPVRFTATGVSAGLVDGQMILRCEVHEGQTVEVAFGPLATLVLDKLLGECITPAVRAECWEKAGPELAQLGKTIGSVAVAIIAKGGRA